MALKQYPVVVNGYKTTLQLSDEDARAMGLTGPAPAEVKATKAPAKAPANKARTAHNKAQA